MRIDTTFLRSKLARRIFWLFVLCALIPITVLAVISVRNVTAQLDDQNHLQLRQASHEEALSVVQRLVFLETNMKLIGFSVRQGPPVSPKPSNAWFSSSFSDKFRGLEVLEKNGSHDLLFGDIHFALKFTPDEQTYLKSGKTLLSTHDCAESSPCIFMSRSLDEANRDGRVLVAEVQMSYLWDAENFPQHISICVLNENARRLFCSEEAPEAFPAEMAQSVSGQFKWERDSKDYLADYWNVFLKPQFYTSHWTVVASESRLDAFLPLSRFKKSFPLVLLLSLWVVLLLSHIQIRRSLIPLVKLQEGTRRIAEGNFASRVTITSDDEFEELATSFNSMAGRIETQLTDLQRANWGALTALARAVDAKSSWTFGHSERVTNWAVKIARSMGLPEKELEIIHRGCLLHDIGKIGTPITILNKAGKLTDDEMIQMRDHVRMGARILEPIPVLAECMPIVLQHHEWVNGLGYPNGLVAGEISLHARIVAVADCYDALISDRPYRPGLSQDRVLQILQEGVSRQFDPEVFEAFLHALAQESHTAHVDDIAAQTVPA